MLSELQFNGWLDTFWQFNLDLSVIVLTVLLVRFFIRKTTKSYNSYLLWLAIPAGFLLAKIIASIDFTSASSSYIGQAVSVMVIKPVETLQNYWWLGAIWLSGTTLLLLRLLIQHVELRRDLKTIQRALTELTGYELFKSRRYNLIAVDQKDMSPAVYGFIKPKIYFPLHVAEKLSVQQIQLIIEHEEQHIKQKHLWLNLLWDVLVCIGWFNPLIYIARKNFRHDQELFCDYLVLNKTDSSRTKDYGHALLSTVSATHSVSLLCSWKVFNQLEERIMNITKPINRTGKVAMSLGAALVLSCCAVYAANKEIKEERVITSENIMIDDSGHKKVIQKFSNDEGIVYTQEGDKYYIIENNGNKRAMTAAERAEFEKIHEEAEQQLHLSEEELRMAEKEIEKAHRELELHVDEIKIAEKEVQRAHEEIALAQEEIVRVYEKGQISKEEMKHARKELERAKKQMNVEKLRKKIRIDVERAKRDLEKARTEIRKQRAKGMKVPPQPSRVFEAKNIDVKVISDASGKKRKVVRLSNDNDKVYLVDDGQYFIEESGKRRKMTTEERAEFEEKIMFIPQPPRMPEAPKAPKPPKAHKSAKADDLTVLEQPRANYPEEAMANDIEGYVNLTFDINGQGKAANVRVKSSSANGIFNKEAIDAIKKWRFAEKDYGKKAVLYQMKFALEN
ncbi:TonB family protein [Kangiella shandongensis]|uniref:TonB family protein n=1 Tax=Kangiella shandongensis TaxID=2763258 RepID=UPI001CBC2B4B|nr:TonB family protein [Kangiella shandongensis]